MSPMELLNTECGITSGVILAVTAFKLLAFFCDCTGQFVSDLVETFKDGFSHDASNLF